MTSETVTPLFEREPNSAPGPFYVVKDACITCSLPIDTAPKNIKYRQRPCTTSPERRTNHCFVSRQPKTPQEIEKMIEIVAASCVAAYRYCGTDLEILRRLVEAGCRDRCDALVQNTGK
jgi:hypothetical protein